MKKYKVYRKVIKKTQKDIGKISFISRLEIWPL